MPAPTVRAVLAAARRCGMDDVGVRRRGRRSFELEAKKSPVTVTFDEPPISAARQRQMDAEDERSVRPWRCLQRWGRQRHVRIGWPGPVIGPIYD